MKQSGNNAFRDDDFFSAEQLYSHALYRAKTHPGTWLFMHYTILYIILSCIINLVLLSNCAAALYRRSYLGDGYHSFRQSQAALVATPNYRKCRLRAVNALKQLKLVKQAKAELEALLEYDTQNNSSKKEISSVRTEIATAVTYLAGHEAEAAEEAARINSLSQFIDYSERFVGHSNCQTDIKEANFLGSEYLAAGSDCGNLFIWHRSGRLVFLGKGDKDIVNCIAPNRYVTAIASSGIDSEIKLWQPVDSQKADAYTLRTNATFFAEQCEVSLNLTVEWDSSSLS